MMTTPKACHVESIIKESLSAEVKRSAERLQEQTQQAIERINNVYTSAINTLKRLELTDATIFEFFQKTDGNIRVYDVKPDHLTTLGFALSCSRPNETNPIWLEKDIKYKIVLMAIRENNNKT